MLPLFARQIAWAVKKMSYVRMSWDTGISYWKLKRLKEGRGNITSVDKRKIQNTYSRYAYKTLRKTAHSAIEARAFSKLIPVNVELKIINRSLLIKEYTVTKVFRYLAERRLQFSEANLNKYYKKAQESIEDTFREKTKKPPNPDIGWDYARLAKFLDEEYARKYLDRYLDK